MQSWNINVSTIDQFVKIFTTRFLVCFNHLSVNVTVASIKPAKTIITCLFHTVFSLLMLNRPLLFIWSRTNSSSAIRTVTYKQLYNQPVLFVRQYVRIVWYGHVQIAHVIFVQARINSFKNPSCAIRTAIRVVQLLGLTCWHEDSSHAVVAHLLLFL